VKDAEALVGGLLYDKEEMAASPKFEIVSFGHLTIGAR
jgi:hypothetical protein